ncbi:MAG: 3'-5' exoribonuclease [Luteolibacter sp.]
MNNPPTETLHLLLDLESLTKRDPRGAIVEIGAVLFCPESGTIGETFFRQIRVTPDNELAEIDTLEWHRKHGRDLDAFKYGHELKDALDDLILWMPPKADLAGVWSWGITYDFPRLEYRFDIYRLEQPWDYFQVKDAR